MKVFDFEDIQLLPKRCIVESRKECDTTQKFGKYEFKIPIIPANMKSVLNEELAIEFAKNGYFYVMHRFNFDSFEFVKKMKKENLISSISIGIKDADYDLINKFKEENIIPEFITIDIAHGHSAYVKRMIKFIRKQLGDEVFIIAGNVATTTAVMDLERWGADATKVGVGPGKVCTTRLKTGFGTARWQLAAINYCSKAATKPIIADGGIRQHGDIAKAIRFGATMVMVGSILSGHEESPGNTIEKNGIKYKEYFGSASRKNKTLDVNIEGKTEMVEVKGSIWTTLNHIKMDLQSAISYAGGNKLQDIKKVDYILLNNNEGY
ncbi:MAG: GMP reductase [Mycoplasma sp.]|nr:GMP reductase [Mycoplasma sp.]